MDTVVNLIAAKLTNFALSGGNIWHAASHYNSLDGFFLIFYNEMNSNTIMKVKTLLLLLVF